MIEIFEYIGSVFTLVAQGLRASPKRIIQSFISSIIGSSILFIYSLSTHQYGFLVLNSVSVIMAIIGLRKWFKVKINE